MKKIVLVAIVFSFLGCSLDDDGNNNFAFEIMPIESVDVPEEFVFGSTHQISVSYTRPNGCYAFNNFVFDSEGNTRTIGVVDAVYLDGNCTQATEEATVSFDFSVISTETYIFQFYQGEDANGEDQYLIVEVPVAE